MQEFEVNQNQKNERLDKVLAAQFTQVSRVHWQELIKVGKVRVDGSVVPQKHKVKMGERIEIRADISPSQGPRITGNADVDVIYEDNDILVINKPSGLVTHPAHAYTDDSVVHRIISYDRSITEAVYDPANPVSVMRPGIVHRLDKDTSGVLIVAKNKQAMSFLAKQIQNKQAEKTYLTLLYGWLENEEIKVENYLGRDIHDRRKMAIVDEERACPQRQQEAALRGGRGRQSKTIFRLKQRLKTIKGDKASLVEASPITGRTHQIRVHANHLGHPVLGDSVYTFKEAADLSNRLGLKRQFLHALKLSIRLPNQTTKTTFTAPLPDDLCKALSQFRPVSTSEVV